MNKIFIVGNACADPQCGITPSGVEYARVNIADNRYNSGEQTAQYWSVTAWRGQAEFMGKYVKKGDKIAITGTIEMRAYIAEDGSKRNSANVSIDTIELMSKPREDSRAPIDDLTPVNDDLPF